MAKLVDGIDRLVGPNTALDKLFSALIPLPQRFQVSRPLQEINHGMNNADDEPQQSGQEHPSGRFAGQIRIDPAEPITIEDDGSIESAGKRRVVTRNQDREEGYNPDGTVAYRKEHRSEKVEEMDDWKREEKPKHVEIPQPGVTIDFMGELRAKHSPDREIYGGSIVRPPKRRDLLLKALFGIENPTFGMKVEPTYKLLCVHAGGSIGNIDVGKTPTIADLTAAKASGKIIDYYPKADPYTRKDRKKVLEMVRRNLGK